MTGLEEVEEILGAETSGSDETIIVLKEVVAEEGGMGVKREVEKLKEVGRWKD